MQTLRLRMQRAASSRAARVGFSSLPHTKANCCELSSRQRLPAWYAARAASLPAAGLGVRVRGRVRVRVRVGV